MRGSIQKRPRKSKKDGKFIEQYFVVYDVGMKWDEEKGQQVRKQKWEKVESPNTLKHAEKILAERLSQLHKGEFIEPTKITFRDFSDTWLKKYASGQIRPSTRALYLSLLRNHLLPIFGDKQLAKIGIEDMQELKSRKLEAQLAPQTVKHILGLLRQMLGHAVDWGYIRTNPGSKVKDPRIPKREMDCLNPAEVREFLKHVPQKWYALFLVAIATGLRVGELLAMKWANVDWNQGKYFVRETLTRKMETQERGFASPKTEGSAQPVDLTPTCLDALTALRKYQAEERLKIGDDYQDLDLVFATTQGTPLNDRNVIQRVFEPALKNAGLRRIRFHDLRHTCASLLIAQGENPKYVQKQLRHASIQITFDRYGHLFPDANREAVRRLDDTLFGAIAQPDARRGGG
jgi:integrase